MGLSQLVDKATNMRDVAFLQSRICAAPPTICVNTPFVCRGEQRSPVGIYVFYNTLTYFLYKRYGFIVQQNHSVFVRIGGGKALYIESEMW